MHDTCQHGIFKGVVTSTRMIHSSSVSTQQITRPQVESSDDARLRLNAAELRGRVRSSASQTEFLRFISDSVDADVQADFPPELDTALEKRVLELSVALDRERMRAAERERILIAQMNGIRDQQVESRQLHSDEMTVSLTAIGAQIDCSRIPREYDVVWTVVSLVLAVDHEKTVAVIPSDKGVISKDHVEFSESPVCFRVPRDTGNVFLHVSVVADAVKIPVFRLILGEWGSPAFIPCLKELKRPESIRAPLPGLGHIDFELMLS